MSSSLPAERPSRQRFVGWRRLLPQSLSSRLIASTLLLVALVSVVVVAVTTLALHSFLLARLDDQVVAAGQRRGGGPSFPPDDFPGTPCAVVPPDDGAGQGRAFLFGQAAGTVIGRFDPQCRSAVVITDGGVLRKVGGADAATLAALSPSGSPQSVALTIGDYRVLVVREPDSRSVTGLPTNDVDDTVRSLVVWEAAVTLGGLAVAALAGRALVRRQLAPLRRVAATAHEVTQLPLESGEVGETVRVPAELTDPATEVGQVGAALNSLLGHVEQALDTRHESEQRVRRFVADASHELRTPLSTIMGYAELTRRTPGDAPAMTHAMARIDAESGRMSALVNDLLLLARLDSGRPLERGDVDVSLLLAETVNDARVVSPDHVWRLALPPGPCRVVGDRDRLQQAVSNLLANAIRHTPAGTTVSVGAGADDVAGAARPVAVVTVHDDGPGMPPSLVGKEFDRFSRGDSSRTRASGGAGLGLSIVQAIVAAHHGSVDIASRPGDTTITLRLPGGADGEPLVATV